MAGRRWCCPGSMSAETTKCPTKCLFLVRISMSIITIEIKSSKKLKVINVSYNCYMTITDWTCHQSNDSSMTIVNHITNCLLTEACSVTRVAGRWLTLFLLYLWSLHYDLMLWVYKVLLLLYVKFYIQLTPLKCIGLGLKRTYAHKRSMQISEVCILSLIHIWRCRRRG